MRNIENYLMNGLRVGYQQNIVLKTELNENSKNNIEYLFTVNVAQQLIEWNEKEVKRGYAINLEYDVEEFLKNTFLPYRIVGSVFDNKIIHPRIKAFLEEEKQKDKKDKEFRYGIIDIGVIKQNVNFSRHRESISGIELKGINPTTESVIIDVLRLVKAMELTDVDFENSLKECYCLHIKQDFTDESELNEEALKNAKKRSLRDLDENIRKSIDFTNKKIDFKIISGDEDNFEFKNVKYPKNKTFKNGLTTYKVSIETKIVYGVIIKIYRK